MKTLRLVLVAVLAAATLLLGAIIARTVLSAAANLARAAREKTRNSLAEEFSRRLPEELRGIYLLAYHSGVGEGEVLPSAWPWKKPGEVSRGRWFETTDGPAFVVAGFERGGEFRPTLQIWMTKPKMVCLVEPGNPETAITIWNAGKEGRTTPGMRPFEAGTKDNPPFFYRMIIEFLSGVWRRETSNLAILPRGGLTPVWPPLSFVFLPRRWPSFS